MSGVRALALPEARELRACGFAAVAEAGVLALPVHLVLTETRRIDVSAPAVVLPFAAAYVACTLLACVFRSSRRLAPAAVVAAMAAGLLVADGDVNQGVFTALLAMLVAFRVVALALRDWRTPIHGDLGWMTVALGVETFVAAGAEPEWRPLLVGVVPVFFVASLASRAATVWTGGGAQDLDEHIRAAWIRRAVLATGGLVAAMAAAVALGVEGGLLDRVGRWLTPPADALASAFGWLAGQVARPIFWLVDRLGIDPEGVRRFFERLRQGGLGDRARQVQPDAVLWQRLLGLVAFVAIGYALYRALRRARPRLGTEEPRSPRAQASVGPLEAEDVPPPRPRIRRELPADAVRRLYAEALLALRRLDLRKEPSLTPAEFAPEVAAARPECAEDFTALTRAYEDVRYGSLRLDRDRVRALEEGQRRLVAAIREGRER